MNPTLNKTLNKAIEKSPVKKRFNNTYSKIKVTVSTLPKVDSKDYRRAFFCTEEREGIYPCVYSPRLYATPGICPTGLSGPLVKTNVIKAIMTEMDYAWRELADGRIEYYPNYEDDTEKSTTQLYVFEGEVYHAFADEWFYVFEKLEDM